MLSSTDKYGVPTPLTQPHIALCAHHSLPSLLFVRFAICFYLVLYYRLTASLFSSRYFCPFCERFYQLTLDADMASSHALRSSNTPTESSFIHIEAWADEAAQTVPTLRLRTPTPDATSTIRSTTMKLEIPLDAQAGDILRGTYVPRRPLSRRDSLKRRDALLMGKEGSRRRQRWENSQFVRNIHCQSTHKGL